MTILPTNISFNTTQTEQIFSYDTNGAIIYVIGVIVWYAIGFGLILIDDINPQPNHPGSRKHVSFYETVTDLHEQQMRNEILVELKDKDRRAKLWQIYYGTQKSHPVMIQKDIEAIELITKQLDELNERRRLLRYTLNEISVEESDAVHIHDDSDSESVQDFQMINQKKANERLKSYFK
ncbi:unnamed protein product [Adineta steineri]|uniref:Uncharacterized protein n=1 Tax=Adineta steineri TaxID=433720 RepID=A0A818IIK5_9BILA|nr:unnamed protein product [Adineta steineri]CAF1003435.1 unnamed protein product [Adineta steineri]CAF3520445.1 unnamed protein product [Adineta steineri]CAF3544827.1 unnamed protein product [Adineta steineri]